MNLEASVKLELDGKAIAEVVLKTYKGRLVIWSHNAASLEYARTALNSYVKVFIEQNIGEYITIREYKAVKAYEEIYEVEEKVEATVDIQI